MAKTEAFGEKLSQSRTSRLHGIPGFDFRARIREYVSFPGESDSRISESAGLISVLISTLVDSLRQHRVPWNAHPKRQYILHEGCELSDFPAA